MAIDNCKFELSGKLPNLNLRIKKNCIKTLTYNFSKCYKKWGE